MGTDRAKPAAFSGKMLLPPASEPRGAHRHPSSRRSEVHPAPPDDHKAGSKTLPTDHRHDGFDLHRLFSDRRRSAADWPASGPLRSTGKACARIT